jgi:hypothetical protein
LAAEVEAFNASRSSSSIDDRAKAWEASKSNRKTSDDPAMKTEAEAIAKSEQPKEDKKKKEDKEKDKDKKNHKKEKKHSTSRKKKDGTSKESSEDEVLNEKEMEEEKLGQKLVEERLDKLSQFEEERLKKQKEAGIVTYCLIHNRCIRTQR